MASLRETRLQDDVALSGAVPSISDVAYDATSWNANLDGASKNAIRDKFESLVIPVASDTAYDATTWNTNTDVPTKNAVRDKIEAMISDTAYDATSWNGVTTIAPSKNAVRDEMETKFDIAGGTLTGSFATPALRYDSADALTLDATHFSVFADATTNAIEIILPDPAGCTGRIYAIKAINIDNGVSITGYDIDGAGYTFAAAMDSVIIQSNGIGWYIIGGH